MLRTGELRHYFCADHSASWATAGIANHVHYCLEYSCRSKRKCRECCYCCGGGSVGGCSGDGDDSSLCGGLLCWWRWSEQCRGSKWCCAALRHCWSVRPWKPHAKFWLTQLIDTPTLAWRHDHVSSTSYHTGSWFFFPRPSFTLRATWPTWIGAWAGCCVKPWCWYFSTFKRLILSLLGNLVNTLGVEEIEADLRKCYRWMITKREVSSGYFKVQMQRLEQLQALSPHSDIVCNFFFS